MIRLAALLIVLASASWAVEPNEMLSDRKLELRAQELDQVIRCVKCRSESIASSNADWARDARNRVRQMISDGHSDQEVLDAFVFAYGEVVLMRPTAHGANLVLWLSPPILLILGFAFALRFQRSRTPNAGHLSREEEAKLQKLIGKQSSTDL